MKTFLPQAQARIRLGNRAYHSFRVIGLRPFAGHMVKNTQNWTAKECARLYWEMQNKLKSYFIS